MTTGCKGTLGRGENVLCLNGSGGDMVSTLGKIQPTALETPPLCPGAVPGLTRHSRATAGPTRVPQAKRLRCYFK